MTARIAAMAVMCAAFAVFAAAQQSNSDSAGLVGVGSKTAREPGLAGNVCPPFFLRDEAGNVINPVVGENADKPYSPKQTCGACHDYEKITQGFHFQQGADEQRPGVLGERCQWVSSPGNYGGAWCSPAPLYSYLSPKHNDDPHLIDMTSLDFITRGCGKCHPGGGPLEYDRDGKRYDKWMADPASGFTPGGENDLDGDYYKARWSESGVLEADCLLCHMPEYDFGTRNQQIAALNFRWTPTAAAGLASVTGAVAKNESVTVTYDASKFDADGKLSPHIVVSPRNETCLQCHAQPGWKKRGANYHARTDVHLRAGMRCVDCHPAGSRADDPRINGREVHQIAKGDDPGGQVRNDLDNTVRDCASCHTTGRLGAPIAMHAGLPPLHLEHIACQTCHIPERLVMPIEMQASDVFNPDPKIPKGGKQLWTFYGVGGQYRNHYGILEMMGYDDKPTETFRPVLARYKGKIYPVNRVHSSWPGIEIEGQPGLMQPRMSDIRKMWVAHRENPEQHGDLSKITDDNGDGVVEVNRPEEIDSLIAAITKHLTAMGYPLEGKRVVWVSDDRVYRSGTEYRTIPTEPWEASAYGNTHKYNHDVLPARAALGAQGCSECHSADAPFFFASTIQTYFDADGRPVTMPQSDLMGYDGRPREYTGAVALTAAFFRWLTIVVLTVLVLHIVLDFIARRRIAQAGDLDPEQSARSAETVQRFNTHSLAQHFVLMVSVLLLFLSGLVLFGLRYPGAGWAAALTGALGGVDVWRIVHRAAGLLLVGVCAYHFVYIVVHPAGRRDFALLLPRRRDFRQFGQNILWFCGARRERPEFGRFTYFEKFDYWAVCWGCIIMVGTGLVMWFPQFAGRVVPGASAVFFDALKEAHAHEAVLAFLAIVIWHTYNVHLRPGRFPGSLFWMHGRITREEAGQEHPAELRGELTEGAAR